MKIFLDANVIVSVVTKEYPLFPYTSRVLSLTEDRRFQLCTSPLCIGIANYFAEKKHGKKEAKARLSLLCRKLTISDCGSREVIAACDDKGVGDLEDGIQYYSALHQGCVCLLTEDSRDFHFARIEVMTSRRFLEKFVFLS
jgi:predicted nucleic acid-binding protein